MGTTTSTNRRDPRRSRAAIVPGASRPDGHEAEVRRAIGGHPLRPGTAPYRLSAALAVAATVSAAVTFLVPGLLTGPAAMNGSARGTALVVAVVAVPLLVAGAAGTARGSARALVLWLGAGAYLLYNAVMLVLATPMNAAFLLYLAMLASAMWALFSVQRHVELPWFADRLGRPVPVRGIATAAWVLVALNAAAWLLPVTRALLAGEPAAVLNGTGLTTNPVYVQDLTFWLPAIALCALWLRRGRPEGYLGTAALLTMLTLEGVGVAVDQWFGATADPSSPVVAMGMVPVFAVVALLTLVPTVMLYRGIDDTAPRRATVPGASPSAGRSGQVGALGGGRTGQGQRRHE